MRCADTGQGPAEEVSVASRATTGSPSRSSTSCSSQSSYSSSCGASNESDLITLSVRESGVSQRMFFKLRRSQRLSVMFREYARRRELVLNRPTGYKFLIDGEVIDSEHTARMIHLRGRDVIQAIEQDGDVEELVRDERLARFHEALESDRSAEELDALCEALDGERDECCAAIGTTFLRFARGVGPASCVVSVRGKASCGLVEEAFRAYGTIEATATLNEDEALHYVRFGTAEAANRAAVNGNGLLLQGNRIEVAHLVASLPQSPWQCAHSSSSQPGGADSADSPLAPTPNSRDEEEEDEGTVAEESDDDHAEPQDAPSFGDATLANQSTHTAAKEAAAAADGATAAPAASTPSSTKSSEQQWAPQARPTTVVCRWKIDDLEACKKNEAARSHKGEYHECTYADAAGNRWLLYYFVDGDGSDNAGHVSLYLSVRDASRLPFGWQKQATFTMTLEHANEGDSRHYSKWATQVFRAAPPPAVQDWGWPKFASHAELVSRGLISVSSNGKKALRVRAVVTVSSSSCEIAPADADACLLSAARLGAAEAVKRCLRAGADARTCRDVAGGSARTPLHLACARGHRADADAAAAAIVPVLTAAGADVDAEDAHGETALHLAVAKGAARAALALLEAGADPTRPVRGASPREDALTLAAGAGRAELAVSLLAAGAPPTAEAVLLAAKKGHLDVLWPVLDAAKEDDCLQELVNARNAKGDTAVALLVARGLVDAAARLVAQYRAPVADCSRDRKAARHARLRILLKQREQARQASLNSPAAPSSSATMPTRSSDDLVEDDDDDVISEEPPPASTKAAKRRRRRNHDKIDDTREWTCSPIDDETRQKLVEELEAEEASKEAKTAKQREKKRAKRQKQRKRKQAAEANNNNNAAKTSALEEEDDDHKRGVTATTTNGHYIAGDTGASSSSSSSSSAEGDDDDDGDDDDSDEPASPRPPPAPAVVPLGLPPQPPDGLIVSQPNRARSASTNLGNLNEEASLWRAVGGRRERDPVPGLGAIGHAKSETCLADGGANEIARRLSCLLGSAPTSGVSTTPLSLGTSTFDAPLDDGHQDLHSRRAHPLSASADLTSFKRQSGEDPPDVSHIAPKAWDTPFGAFL